MKNIYFIALLASMGAMLTSCEEMTDSMLNFGTDEYVQSFQWSYRDRDFSMEIHVPRYVYDHYHSLPRDLPYQAYVTEDPQYPYLDTVVAGLCRIAAPLHLSEREMDQFVMNFCQSIPYRLRTYDKASPRFAVETLVDKEQICCDVSILCVTLLSAMGRHTCLLLIASEKHMAAGVAVSGHASNFYRGRTGLRYLFMECTNPGWELAASSCPDDSAAMYEFGPDFPQSSCTKMTEGTPHGSISSQLNYKP